MRPVLVPTQFRRRRVRRRLSFLYPDQIEFDLLPEEVTGPERLAAVASFLRGLAAVAHKPAVLTMENVPDAVILPAYRSLGQSPGYRLLIGL